MIIPRWLRWIGFGFLGLALLIVLVYTEEDWRGARAWARVKQELQARGEPLEFAKSPSVSDDLNAAAAPVFTEYFSAAATDAPNRIHNTSLGKMNEFIFQHGALQPFLGAVGSEKEFDVVGWQKYFTGKENPATAAADILKALQPYDETICEVRQALDRPIINWPQSPFDKNPNNRFSYLQSALVVGRFLSMRALAEIEARQSDAAIDDLELQLRLSTSLNSRPLLICHLVSLSIDNMSYIIVERGLEKHLWDDVRLRRIEGVLAQRNPLTDFQEAMKGERVFFIENATLLSESPGKAIDLGIGEKGRRTLPIRVEELLFELIPRGWFDLSEAFYSEKIEADFIDPINANQGNIDLERLRAAFDEEEAHGKWNLSSGALSSAPLLYSLRASLKKTANDQALLNEARTACALEDYRLKNSRLPDTLDSLVPDFLPALPPDPVAAGPLHYVRSGDDDYLLYSVGWNGKDDGGVIARKKGETRPDLDNGDWVWASRAALYHFIESPSKAGS